MTWEQSRVIQHVMLRSLLDPARPRVRPNIQFQSTDELSLKRAQYLASLAPIYAQLDVMPGEMRFSCEPLHPLTDVDLQLLVGDHLRSAGVANPLGAYGLNAISRTLVDSYGASSLFDNAKVPMGHEDLFLFDPIVGFVLWREGDRNRNAWLGNMRDTILAVRQMPEPLRSLLVQRESDHFSYGKSLFNRVIGPLLQKRRYLVLDDADIPTVEIESQADLEAFSDDLRNACERCPLPVSAFFRGQANEHLLPDRTDLVQGGRGPCPYADVRDHSVVPSLYRRYDSFLNDLSDFSAFLEDLLEWHLRSDLVFGDPAQYLTLDGAPYTPKRVPSTSQATVTTFASGESANNRALEDVGPYNVWSVTDESGAILDQYVKRFRPGHDTARRNLILQHYGAHILH